MYVVLLLFCLVNFAGCAKLNPQDATIEKVKGEDALLKWTYSKRSGETFLSGTLNVVRSGTTTYRIVATLSVNNDRFNWIILSPYSGRGWSISSTAQVITFSAKAVQTADDATYSVSLVYSTGSDNKQNSSGIRLVVLVKPFFPSGSFTEGTVTANEGRRVEIKCEPDGSPKPITINWNKNDVPFSTKYSTDPNLVFQTVNRSNSGTYTCRPWNKAGWAEKFPKTELIVKYKPVKTTFNVTGVLVKGKKGSLKCSAEANPKAVYTITGGGISVTDGAGTVDLPEVKISLHSNKDVTCTPRNELGAGPTVRIRLDVQVPPTILEFKPKKMDAIKGRNLSISCYASGKPAVEIKWLHDGSEIPNTPPSSVTVTLPDTTYKSVATLRLGPVKLEDNGKYTCEAKNAYGTDYDVSELNVWYLPEVRTITRDKEVRVGSHVVLDCVALGNPRVTYYVWRRDNGSVIQNKTDGNLEFRRVQPSDGGRLSCAGISTLGEGPKRYLNLFVQVPPQIVVPPKRAVSLNESERLLLFCNASGVPKPTIQWSQADSSFRATGELLSIPSVKYFHKGKYTCTASNGIEPNATASCDVTIYFRPVIITNTAAATIKGAEDGAEVPLVCQAEAMPLAELKWLHFPSQAVVNETDHDIVKIEKTDDSVIILKVRAKIGVKYWCFAENNRGNATQLYEIRSKGIPEAPVLDKVETYIHNAHDQLSTVRADIKWTPGYDGGQRVWFKISYGPRADKLRETQRIEPDCNCYTIKEGLKANTEYLFFVRAHNGAGSSNSSKTKMVKTAAFYGKASVERFDEGKIAKVTLLRYTQENLTKAVIRYREPEQSLWTRRDVYFPRESFVIQNLDPEKLYEFQVLWYFGKQVQITDAGEVAAWKSPGTGERSSSSWNKEEIIAIIAGVGGFLLIVILVVFLCLIRRRQKPKRDQAVVVMRRQTPGSISADVVTRRSLIGSVEDDPFESAHYGNGEKKKARDSYYLPGSEDLNTFAPDNTGQRNTNPAENSQAYQPYRFDKKPKYEDSHLSSDDEPFQYSVNGKKGIPSDDELSSEPGYARPEDVRAGRNARDHVDGGRERPKPNKNDVYAKINKDNNNRPGANSRGAPPPYRPRSTADAPRNLPTYYPEDQLDLDDPSAVPYEDPLPPPMPVLPSSHSVPDDMWDDRNRNPRDSSDSTLERHKSPSRTSLPGKPYINVHGKLVRPGSSGRLSSSAENINDDEGRSPEPEVPSRRSRQMEMDNDETNLVSYLV